ncbi:MAG: DNA-binding FadR family transcriptional regulator [Paracoccaceae bacterium]|jgi:DNA-binding FadR family transcriptional regulator
MSNGVNAAMTQLRAWLAQAETDSGAKLPAERELCAVLGVSRGDLRKVLSVLEKEGALWRQVGKGTFVGPKPETEDLTSLSAIAARSSPGEVIRARLKFEPVLAAEAAVNASAENLEEMKGSILGSRAARTWREYETCDNWFHRVVARSAGNVLLLSLFDQMNAVRRAVVWSRGRNDQSCPPENHHSFFEHDAIFDAIVRRDAARSHEAMHRHLSSVETALMARKVAAE